MKVPSLADDLEVFHQYGLPLAHEVKVGSKAYTKAMEDIQALLFGMVFQQGWTDDAQRHLGRIVNERFFSKAGAGSITNREVDAQIRMAHAFYLYRTLAPRAMGLEVETLIATEQSRKYATMAGLWYEQAFPKVVLEATQQASLMTTALPKEAIPTIIAPWMVFQIELKDSVLTYRNVRNEEMKVDRIMVYSTRLDSGEHSGELGWRALILAGVWELLIFEGVHDFFAKDPFIQDGHVLEGEPEDIEAYNAYRKTVTGLDFEESVRVRKTNSRLITLVSSLIGNLCLAMSDTSRLLKEKTTSKLGRIKTKTDRILTGLPAIQTYKLGLPVQVDVREKIAEYLSGERSSAPTVRFLVRGHWKNQPCGPKGMDRKWIHVQSYWKGEGPILVRPHTLELG